MRPIWYRVGLLLCTFVFGLGLMSPASQAISATPTPAQSFYPAEFCTPEQIAAIDSGDEDSPLEFPYVDALVSPASVPDMDLYVVRITLPPHACVAFNGHLLHDGAVVWLVESGTVTFGFQLIHDRPVPDLVYQPLDGPPEPVGPVMQLSTGDWVSTDRAVHYSYVNDEDTPAVVIMTVLEKRWVYTGNEFDPLISTVAECKHVCRNPRR
jgi:hypothetical protein